MALDARTGKIDFTFDWRSRSYESANASSPVIIGNQVLLTAAYKTGAVLLEIPANGRREVAWVNPTFDLHFSTAVHHDGYLYGFPGRNEQDAALACVDLKTGREEWRTVLEWPETIERGGEKREITESILMEDTKEALARLTRLAHEVVGYISFFTVGPDECRAWAVRKGSPAPVAAGSTTRLPPVRRGLLVARDRGTRRNPHR